MEDWSDLDELFSCPASVTDPKLKQLYEALYARLKKELESIGFAQVSTAQLIQGSLMTGWTVKHLQTSRKQYQDKQGYQHPGQEKDAVMSLESILRDWNDVMLKARALHDKTPQGIPVEVVQEALAGALSSLDQEVRIPILSDIAGALGSYAG